MANKPQLMKLSDLPPETCDEIGRHLWEYATGLILVTNESADQEYTRLIGTGTFVSVDNIFGILSAQHVIKELLRKGCSLGLTLQESPHKYTIDRRYLGIHEIAKGSDNSQGPDLGFIVLPSSTLGTIKATKSFHNLTLKRDLMLINAPNCDLGL